MDLWYAAGTLHPADRMAVQGGHWIRGRSGNINLRIVPWILGMYASAGVQPVFKRPLFPAADHNRQGTPEKSDSFCAVCHAGVSGMADHEGVDEVRGLKRQQKKGSYTIEISLLMGLILPVLTGIIYMNFFLHDRAFLQAAAHETVSWISLHPKEDSAEQVMEKLVQGRMLGTEAVDICVNVGSKEVTASGSGTFRMPGMLQNLFEKTGVENISEVHLRTEPPSRRIQKIRGLMKTAEGILN